MAVTPDKSAKEMAAALDERYQRLKAAAIYQFQALGEKCINDARSKGSYTDQSGNLRSSIGYILLDDGKIVTQSNFVQVKEGKDGVKNGKKYAEEVAKKFANQKGIVLIVVAGMNYAAYVEKRGRNVLLSSEVLAKNLLPDIFRKLGLKGNTYN